MSVLNGLLVLPHDALTIWIQQCQCHTAPLSAPPKTSINLGSLVKVSAKRFFYFW